MKRPTEKQVNWAHSVLNDCGHNDEMKHKAAGVIRRANYDPDYEPDPRDGGILDEDNY